MQIIRAGSARQTSALNLAGAFAREGYRVLLVDLDPQASASGWIFGGGALDLYAAGRSVAQVLLKNADIRGAIVRAGEQVRERCAPFDCLTSHIDLAEADGERRPA